MKVLFFIPSLGPGGAERVVSVLANSFCGLGHQTVIAMLANNRINYILHNSVKTICLADQWQNCTSASWRIIKRIQAIKKIIKSEKPDVVISFMAETNIDVSAALLGCHTPLIVSERNDPSLDPASRLKKLFRNFLYWRPDGFVFQTEDAKHYFKWHVQKKSTIILNPLVSKLPAPFEGEREKKIVSVGRLEKQKNYPMLLQAFEKFHQTKPEYILEIYGEGQEEETLRDIIKQKGLSDSVKLMGFCSEVHERINKAAMYIMSSDYEGLPNALIEAMALGLPCISTDCPCGGPRTLIENGVNGLLVHTDDTNALVKAINDILEDSRFSEIGENARKIREKVNPELVTAQWLQFITRIKG